MQKAFTLAEVLITLGIIGVVAALTIPSLIQKHKKVVLISKLKKISSVISQAYNTYTADNGISPSVDCGDCLLPDDPDNALDVFNKYFMPYLKGAQTEKGTKGVFVYLPDDTAVYFRRNSTDNDGSWGYTYFFACITHKACEKIENETLFNSITNGKDVFLLYYDGTPPKMAYKLYTRTQLIERCKNQAAIEPCTALIVGDGWQVSKDYPIRL